MDDRVRVLLSGFFGKMGRQVLETAADPGMRSRIQIIGGLEYPNHPELGKVLLPVGDEVLVASLDEKFHLPEEFSSADVLIDFSNPAVVSAANAMAAAWLELPVIIFSAGHTEQHLEFLERCARKIPCLLWDLPNYEEDTDRETLARASINSALWLRRERLAAGMYPMSGYISEIGS